MPEAQQIGFEPQPEVTRTPVIREIEVTIFRTAEPDHPEGPQSIRFRLTIDDQFGQPMNHYHGDLLPYLTDNITQQLIAFMDYLWAKAEAEVTP